MTTPLFTVLLIGVIMIVGALTFFPALSLGPILEHLLMNAGKDSENNHVEQQEAIDLGPEIVRAGRCGCPRKLNPRKMMGNPVMFVVEVGSVITTVLLFRARTRFRFNLQITLWLWFTVLFANFAEAMAEGRGKAQADTLRKARSETVANRMIGKDQTEEVSQLEIAARGYGAGFCRRTHSLRRRDHGGSRVGG